MPALAALLELNNLEARTENLKSQVQENKAKALLYGEQAALANENAQLERTTREAAQAAQLAQDNADGAITPESALDVAGASNPVQKAIAESMRTIRDQQALAAQIRRQGGDGKAAEKAESAAASARQVLFHNMNLAFDQQREAMKRVSSAAGALLPDGSNVGQVQTQLDALNPKWMQGADVDTDIYGNLAPGKRTAKYLSTMAMQGVSAEKQLEARQKALDQEIRADQLKQRKVEENNRNLRHDQDTRLRRDGIDARREATDQRRDDARERREAKAAGKEPKAPTKAEVDSTAALFQQEPDMKLPADQAQAAAWDYHRRVNEILKKNPDMERSDAEAEAMDDIKSRVKPGEKEGGIFGFFQKDGKAQYEKWKEAEGKGEPSNTYTEQDVTGLNAVGVGVTTKGKLQVLPGKTPPAKAELIKEAQAAIDAGKDRAAVLKRLKELMVK